MRTHLKFSAPAIAALATLVVLSTASLASAAELVTAELTGTVNDVTVQQGASAGFTIDVSATGAIACSITSSSPSTATVDTAFSLNSAGTLSSGTPSSALSFFSDGVPQGSSGNCGVTWSVGPTDYSVSASVS